MVPALPDLALAPSYASLPVAAPRAQNLVVTSLLSTYFQASGRDTDLALSRMMTEPGRRRLHCTMRSYDSLLQEVRSPSLGAFKHGVLGFV